MLTMITAAAERFSYVDVWIVWRITMAIQKCQVVILSYDENVGI